MDFGQFNRMGYRARGTGAAKRLEGAVAQGMQAAPASPNGRSCASRQPDRQLP